MIYILIQLKDFPLIYGNSLCRTFALSSLGYVTHVIIVLYNILNAMKLTLTYSMKSYK